MELQWCAETSTAEFQHKLVVRTTAGPPQYDKSVFLRAVCCYLLTKLPDDGLPDVCRSIADAYEYYVQSPRVLRPYEVHKLKPSPIKAKAGRTYERPSFPIVEE
jgi:hypothetical protein